MSNSAYARAFFVLACLALPVAAWLAVTLAYDRGFAEGRASAPEAQCGPCPCVPYDYPSAFVRVLIYALGLGEIAFVLYPHIQRRILRVQEKVVKTEKTS